MSIDLVIALYQGMHFEGELRMINRLADGVMEGVIVAIGGYRGQSDCALALHAHVPVYCIDRRESDEYPGLFGDEDRVHWMTNVLALGLGAKVRPINLRSIDVAKIWSEPIGLLWVDGDHAYEAVKADLDAWLPFVVDGGIVITHDANTPGTIQAMAERTDLVEFERADITVAYHKEPLYEQVGYEGLTFNVRKGPYNKDDRHVVAEVRGYDIGDGPIRTVIDVGAQIGAFSAWMHQLYPDAEIFAVEPETSGFLALRSNIPADGKLITALNARVNYDDGDKLLFVDPVNSGSHRIIDVAQPGMPYVSAPPAITLEEIMRVQGWTTLSLLKVDCEQCENDVLMNCTDQFLRSTSRVVGEFHLGYVHFMATIGARLQSLGFTVTGQVDDGISHSVFVAVNEQWVEEDKIISAEEIDRLSAHDAAVIAGIAASHLSGKTDDATARKAVRSVTQRAKPSAKKPTTRKVKK